MSDLFKIQPSFKGETDARIAEKFGVIQLDKAKDQATGAITHIKWALEMP